MNTSPARDLLIINTFLACLFALTTRSQYAFGRHCGARLDGPNADVGTDRRSG